MNKFLYGMLGYILLPFLLIFSFIYGICHVTQILCVKYKDWFNGLMHWIDKNITQNIN